MMSAIEAVGISFLTLMRLLIFKENSFLYAPGAPVFSEIRVALASRSSSRTSIMIP